MSSSTTSTTQNASASAASPPPSIWTNLASQWSSSLQPVVIQLAQLYIVQMVDTGNRVRDNLVVSGAVILLQMAIQIVNSIVQAVWTAVCEPGGSGDKGGTTVPTNNALVRFLLQWFGLEHPTDDDDSKTPKLIDHREVQAYVDKNYENDDKFNVAELRFVCRVKLAKLHRPIELVKAWLRLRTTSYVVLPSKKKWYTTVNCTEMQLNDAQYHVNDWFSNVLCHWDSVYFPVLRYQNDSRKNGYVFAYFGENDKMLSFGSSNETYGIQCYNEFYQFCNDNKHLCDTINIKPCVVDHVPIIKILSVKADNTLTNVNGCFTSKKVTFQNLSFVDKPLLQDWLSRFQQGSVYPANLKMSNKLGILLYGPPGTGKTACAVAIAQHLGRNINTIDNSVIQAGFYNFVNYLSDNPNNTVHVFDEFDAFVKQLIRNELAQKRDKTEKSEMEQYTALLAVMAEKRNKDKDNNASPDSGNSVVDYSNFTGKVRPMTITDFIRALDSIYDDSERVIVATTNYVSELSSVLLRPGRFDLKIEMGYCSASMVTEILNMGGDPWAEYAADISPETIACIVEMNVTPLVLINSMLQSNCTSGDLLEKIRRNLKFDSGAHQVQKEANREVAAAPFVDMTADDDNLSSDDTQSM